MLYQTIERVSNRHFQHRALLPTQRDRPGRAFNAAVNCMNGVRAQHRNVTDRRWHGSAAVSHDTSLPLRLQQQHYDVIKPYPLMQRPARKVRCG